MNVFKLRAFKSAFTQDFDKLYIYIDIMPSPVFRTDGTTSDDMVYKEVCNYGNYLYTFK